MLGVLIGVSRPHIGQSRAKYRNVRVIVAVDALPIRFESEIDDQKSGGQVARISKQSAACKIRKSMIDSVLRNSRYGSKNRDLSGHLDLYFCR
jgi:hypothetical protein